MHLRYGIFTLNSVKSKVVVIMCLFRYLSNETYPKTNLKIPETFFFLQIRLYYVDLHFDAVMTESGMYCKLNWKSL